tara:strand:+ start:1315 stop:2673 length:1359 start_codon:yes stop_codon:yes gene_type:complete
MKLTKDIIGLSPLFFIGVLLVFNRPFVGIRLFGLRIGELIIGGGLLISLIVLILFISAKRYLNFFESYSSKLSFVLIIATFFISIFIIYDTDIFSTYTYKISSYIWTTSYIFVGAYLLNNQDLLRKYKTVILPLFLFVPIAHYILSTGYYPNFIIDIFKKYSDKFQFTKASDIMLSLLIANILNYKLTVSKYFKFSYMLFSVCLLSPLLLLMSRGAFISTIAFTIISLYYFRHYIAGHFKKVIYMSFFSFFVLILSIYNVNGVDYSFNVNFGGNIVSEGDLSLSTNFERIVKKDEQRKAFLSLYFENGRIVSHDNTTNWRLDIWQDAVEDMNHKNLIMKGYGYNEILPVMTDPSAPGRLGRDGLNEHVHNYFVNIFARGGVFQFLLFLIFHLGIILYWKRKYLNYTILLFMVPSLLAASLDMSMEGVQYPIVYYLFLGYLLSTQQKSKIINF